MSTGKTYSTKYLQDSKNNRGSEGQILSSTSSGIDWVTLSEISGVDGTGTANYLSKWLDANTITNSLVYDNGTNVGIGTTTPASKLQVSTTNAANILTLHRDGSDNGANTTLNRIQFAQDYNSTQHNWGRIDLDSNASPYRSDLKFYVKSTSGSEMLGMTVHGTASDGPRVGIGTTTPNYKLEVNGSIGLPSSLYFTGTTANIQIGSSWGNAVLNFKNGTTTFLTFDVPNGRIVNNVGKYLTSSSNTAQFGTLDNQSVAIVANNSEKIRILANGDVGIGTTSPVNKLQANYSPVAIASLTATSGTASTNWNRNAGLMITGASLSNALALGTSGTANDRKAWIQVGHPDTAANSLGTLALNPLGGNVGIGTVSPSYKLSINGSAGIESSEQYLYFHSSASVGSNARAKIRAVGAGGGSGYGGDLRISTRQPNNVWNEDAVIVDSSGNVGIGITNPVEALNVGNNGNIRIDGNASGRGIFASSNGSNNTFSFTRQDGVNIADLSISGYGGVGLTGGRVTSPATSGYDLYVKNGGNVGIGTTSPSSKLEVVEATANTAATITVDSASWDAMLSLKNANGTWTILNDYTGAGTTGALAFWNGSYRMVIDNTGNVGIGTTSPDRDLHVRGSSAITRIESTASSQNSQLDIKSTTATWSVGQNISLANTGNLEFYNGSSSPVVIKTNGKVGIGTTSPNRTLSIVGQIGIDNALSPSAGLLISLDGSSNKVYSRTANDSTTAHPLDFMSGSSMSMRIAANGNVGIGTTAPSSKLHINGDLTVGGGDIVLGGTGRIQGINTVTASTDAASKEYVDAQSYITAPNAPASVTTTIVGETIDVTFAASTTSDIDAYLVYSSIDGSDYALISLIPPDDFSASMSVIDNAFTETGTQAYRVYAMKKGVLSSATTGSVAYAVSSAEPTTMSVIDLNNAFYVQWNPPSSNGRFVTAYNVYKDENAIQANLLRSNATLVYSGLNTNFMNQISGTNNNNFHQFWVETTIA